MTVSLLHTYEVTYSQEGDARSLDARYIQIVSAYTAADAIVQVQTELRAKELRFQIQAIAPNDSRLRPALWERKLTSLAPGLFRIDGD